MGHTRLRIAGRVAESGIGEVEVVAHPEFEEWLDAGHGGRQARFWLAAVPGAEVVSCLTDALDARGIEWRRIRLGEPVLPVAPAYAELGVDRWLAMQVPWREIGDAFCVVDCGTATTFDVVDAEGRHLGGWIVPGRDAARSGLLGRAPGLHREAMGTGRFLDPATSTADAVDRGLKLQQIAAIEVMSRAAAERLGRPSLPLFATGGDLDWIESAGRVDRVAPYLALEGLALAVAHLDR